MRLWPLIRRARQEPVTLTLRLESENPRHAHVTVFDGGANAGRLVLDAETWHRIVTADDYPDRVSVTVRRAKPSD